MAAPTRTPITAADATNAGPLNANAADGIERPSLPQ